MDNSALIFIPDISGFTEFVTQTDIQHSNHIISELIEVIINANQLDLKISEIEGDAILYYKPGEPPTIEQIFNQSKKMFIDFHAYLKVIERDSVCQCGACRTASNLSLKFVTHYGQLREVAIQNFNKIMGSDVILAHRLLKNDIPSNEYLLLTEMFLDSQKVEGSIKEYWVKLEDNIESFENFGEIKTRYINLSELLKVVPELTKLEKRGRIAKRPDITTTIDAPLLLVHEVLTDNSSKRHWVPGIKEIREDSKINRVNSSHTCVFDNLEVHFVTKANEVKKKEIIYSEEGEVGPDFSFVSDFKLTEVNSSTKLEYRIIERKKSNSNGHVLKDIFSKIKAKFLIAFSLRGQRKSLKLFKEYCEKLYAERESTQKI